MPGAYSEFDSTRLDLAGAENQTFRLAEIFSWPVNLLNINSISRLLKVMASW
ncbi:MAG: hypothetical protein OFPI_39790 [Osedax symbiont Rs2]|nr:MAG: hypothetical protein OFPI_39790 [Osedax symbiont Rs2]